MIIKFTSAYLEDLYEGKPLKGKPRFPPQIIEGFKRKVLIMKNASHSIDLYKFRSLNFEALKGDREGTYSVRINKQYRIEFRISEEQITELEIVTIEDLSKHYEN